MPFALAAQVDISQLKQQSIMQMKTVSTLGECKKYKCCLFVYIYDMKYVDFKISLFIYV
jgi:hypothetical protein